MSATPMYDNVVEELRIDPERIAARPAWSLQAAERRRWQQETLLSRTWGDTSAHLTRAGFVPAGPARSWPRPSTPTAAAT